MIINRPALDYFRGTTFSFASYQKAAQSCTPPDESGKRGSFMQYRGNRYKQIFHGQGEQNGRTHYMLDISGESADDLRGRFLPIDLHTTRIDLQITIEKPDWYKARELCDGLRSSPWPNKVRNVLLIDGGGEDTVYVGSRESERYIRIYVKNQEWIRYEVELKGTLATIAAKTVARGGENAIAGVLLSELKKMPAQRILDVLAISLLKHTGKDIPDLRVTRIETTKIKRMRWLASLLTSIKKMMLDDDYGHTVIGWFSEMILDVQTIRNGNDETKN